MHQVFNRLVKIRRISRINYKYLSQMSQPTSNKHKIAVCQLTCTEDKDKNFNICKSLIIDAKNQGAKVVIIN